MILECRVCNGNVEASEVEHYEDTVYDDEESCGTLRYTLLRCPTCKSPFLVAQGWVHRSGTSTIGGRLTDLSVLYPPPYKRVDPSFPSNILRSYEEALKCLKVGAHTACALMCRKTMEALCAEHQVKAKKLAPALEELRSNDVIDGRLFDWADGLRLAGNEAAHEVSQSVSKQDAMDIIDFTHALLEYTFTFRDKFNEFMKRRKKPSGADAGGDQQEE